MPARVSSREKTAWVAQRDVSSVNSTDSWVVEVHKGSDVVGEQNGTRGAATKNAVDPGSG